MFLKDKFRRKSGLSHCFATLHGIVPETAIVSFRILPFRFPLPAITIPNHKM